MSLKKNPLLLNKNFEYLLNLIESSSSNLFITGRAGTGKSTLLKLLKSTTKKNIVVLAPTGVAALNVGGQTIHSFFKFPPKPDFEKSIKKRRNRKLFNALDLLIIDEISMVRADLLDGIDYFLRLNRESDLPFGGVQMIFFGDLFQLPPVVSSPQEKIKFKIEYDSPYFFSSNVMQFGFDLETIELKKVFRQEQRFFIRLLDAVRLNRTDYDDLKDLNERYFPNFEHENLFITLSATNRVVNSINKRRLAELHEKSYFFSCKLDGDFRESQYPVDARMELKVGAQVMFIRNDTEKQFVNGTIGTIKKLSKEKIVVEIKEDDGERRDITVEKFTWEILKYKQNTKNNKIETEVIGTFTQYPIKLAWAITIHKSQGKTFKNVIIDLGHGGAFEHGQTYVALSRCTSLEGIILKRKLQPKDIIIDQIVVDFFTANVD